MQSFLSHRRQYVNINSSCSTIQTISTGVPQGSILRPLLFNLYAYDRVNIGVTAKFVTCADDTTMLFAGSDYTEIIDTANAALSCMTGQKVTI